MCTVGGFLLRFELNFDNVYYTLEYNFTNWSVEMPAKQPVHIQIESKFEKHSLVQSVEGELIVKGSAAYVRYAEPDPSMGKTNTTVKFNPGEIKVIRHGDVESEQLFSLEGKNAGFYKTAQGAMNLAVDTRSISVDLDNGLGEASWSYDLYISGEFTGRYELKLTIQEGQKK
jgi:uncharacterized beta-barrel protein YwiB (DUF1934 family)